jgi:dCMP deaminase
MEKLILSYLMQENRADDWDNMFFATATLWSRKSHDIQTQCGCVLVKNKTIIATGYNGFMRGIDDYTFPNTRPEKYPFMIHAEANAVYNAARQGQSTEGARAYITAIPCRNCLQMLWQCGITEVYYTNVSAPKADMWGDGYNEVLKQIEDRITFKFFPKKYLCTDVFLESAEKMKKKPETY